MSMIYRTLGRTGLRVSLLSFGSWVSFKSQLDEDAAYQLMVAAFEAGVNFFDCAEGYAEGEAEIFLGKAVARGIAEGKWTRHDLVISTKIFFGAPINGGGVGGSPVTRKRGINGTGLSRKHIVEGLQASLKRLQMDYVDVVFAHRQDPTTPLEETVRAFNHCIDRGMAFYWGTSEWTATAIAQAAHCAERFGGVGPTCEQPQYNLMERTRVEKEYAHLYASIGTGLTIWSPLASGILTGKYSGGKFAADSRLGLAEFAWLKDSILARSPDCIDKADALGPIAASLGCTPAQVAIAWCCTNPHVSTVILGASKLSQLQENLQALAVVPKLTAEVLAQLEAAFPAPAMDAPLGMVMRIRGRPDAPPFPAGSAAGAHDVFTTHTA